MMLKSYDSTGTDWMVLLITPEREGAALSSAVGTAPTSAPPSRRYRHRRAPRGPGATGPHATGSRWTPAPSGAGPDHLDRAREREGCCWPLHVPSEYPGISQQRYVKLHSQEGFCFSDSRNRHLSLPRTMKIQHKRVSGL